MRVGEIRPGARSNTGDRTGVVGNSIRSLIRRTVQKSRVTEVGVPKDGRQICQLSEMGFKFYRNSAVLCNLVILLHNYFSIGFHI